MVRTIIRSHSRIVKGKEVPVRSHLRTIPTRKKTFRQIRREQQMDFVIRTIEKLKNDNLVYVFEPDYEGTEMNWFLLNDYLKYNPEMENIEEWSPEWIDRVSRILEVMNQDYIIVDENILSGHKQLYDSYLYGKMCEFDSIDDYDKHSPDYSKRILIDEDISFIISEVI